MVRFPASERGAPRPLASLIRDDPESWAALRAGVAARAAEMGGTEREELAALLYPDLFSEYDARFLSAFVRSLDCRLSPHFCACEHVWNRDEELHYTGFRVAYGVLTVQSEESIDARMAARASDVRFEPLRALFEDEFHIACLVAYDELATVRAYRANAPTYERLGPEMVAFVKRVTADEGRHYRNFFRLIRDRHAHRLDELGDVLERIRAHEGIPYGNTFVLDHDDDVWSDEIFDDAMETLRRHLHA